MTNANPHTAQVDEVLAEIRTRIEERLSTNPIDEQALALAVQVHTSPTYTAMLDREVEDALPLLCALVAVKVSEAV